MSMEPLKYDQIHYNEPILWLEQRWNRKLKDHEKEIVKLIYRWTRTTQEAEEIKILEAGQFEKAKKYEKALEFYADKENYEEWNAESNLSEFIHSVDFDGGDIARKVLEK